MFRSRRELSNALLLAKFGFDTAENEPDKVCSRPSRTFFYDLADSRPGGSQVPPRVGPPSADHAVRAPCAAAGAASGLSNKF